MTHAQETITRLLAAHGYQAESVRPLGAGLDHTAFDVDGELVARLSRLPDPAERAREVEREAQLLHRIAAISPLAVPTPLYTDPDGGWLAYRKLPGEPLLGLPVTAQLATTVGSALGRLLAVLHAQPPEAWAGLVEDDDAAPLAWPQEARGRVLRRVQPSGGPRLRRRDGPGRVCAEQLVRPRPGVPAAPVGRAAGRRSRAAPRVARWRHRESPAGRCGRRPPAPSVAVMTDHP